MSKIIPIFFFFGLDILTSVDFSSHPIVTKVYDPQTRGLSSEFHSLSGWMAPAANSDSHLGLCHFLPVHKHQGKE